MLTTTYILAPVQSDYLEKVQSRLLSLVGPDLLLACYTLVFAKNIFGKVKVIKENVMPHEGANYAWFWIRGFVCNWIMEKNKITVALPMKKMKNAEEYLLVTDLLLDLGFWKRSNLPYYLGPIAFILMLQITLQILLQPIGLGVWVIIITVCIMAIIAFSMVYSIHLRGAPLPSFLAILHREKSPAEQSKPNVL